MNKISKKYKIWFRLDSIKFENFKFKSFYKNKFKFENVNPFNLIELNWAFS